MELIQINESKFNGIEVETVSARDLHSFLDVKSKFSDWIKNRISEYGFSEHFDYWAFSKNLESGGRTLEYYMTINMAKELSMVERNEKGKQARQYFIKCEEIAKSKNEFQLPQTFSEALLLAHEQAKQLEEQAPKVRYFDKVSKNETHMNATQVGQKFKMSATILNRHLTEHGIYNKTIKRSKVFTQWFIDKEYGEMKQTELGYSQAVFTTKGEQFIAELLTSEGII